MNDNLSSAGIAQRSHRRIGYSGFGTYVDATFGGGGHSREILKRLGKKGRLYAFDQDEDAAAQVPDDKRILFTRGNFRFLENYLRFYGVKEVNGILADLGVSSITLMFLKEDSVTGMMLRWICG